MAFRDLDAKVPHPVVVPNADWVEAVADAKEEFEFYGAATSFTSWRVEQEDLLDLGDVRFSEGILARAGRLALDARLTDERAARLLSALPRGNFILRMKFLKEGPGGDWTVEDKFDPVRVDRRKGGTVVEISRKTRPGALQGIDQVFYQNAYPVTAVVYGLYPIRDPDPANLAPLRTGALNCVAKRVVEHFQGALRGQGLTPARRLKIWAWEELVHEKGATVADVAKLEKILKRAVVLKDIAGEDIYNSGKYRMGGNGVRGVVELICHNGHAWSSDLRFPQASQVKYYEGNVWEAIREATRGAPLAVWLLGGGAGRRLTVDQFVLQDGRTYRTREAHEILKTACGLLGDESLADRAFGVNHVASVVAKERNRWRLIGRWAAGVHGARAWRPLELDGL